MFRHAEPIYKRVGYVFYSRCSMHNSTDFYDFEHPE